MAKKIIILGNVVLIILTLSLVGGCSKKEETKVEYNNNVFTETMYENLVEINYWSGNTRIVISNKEDIQEIFSYLASLNLSDLPQDDILHAKMGHSRFDLVLKDKTICLGILSGEIGISDIGKYQTNKDIVSSIRSIALQSK